MVSSPLDLYAVDVVEVLFDDVCSRTGAERDFFVVKSYRETRLDTALKVVKDTSELDVLRICLRKNSFWSENMS